MGQAVAGELSSTDDALKRLAADIDEQVKAAKQVSADGPRLRPAASDPGRRSLHGLMRRASSGEASWAVTRSMGHATRTPWLFLTPNLLIFGVFTFLPIAINVWYAFTGGVALYPKRPALRRAWRTLSTLLDCEQPLPARHLHGKDLFWRAVWNTAQLLGAAGGADGAGQPGSLRWCSTARSSAAASGAGVFFYPVLLSRRWWWRWCGSGSCSARACSTP